MRASSWADGSCDEGCDVACDVPWATSVAGSVNTAVPSATPARRRKMVETITIRWPPWAGCDAPTPLSRAQNGLFGRCPQGRRPDAFKRSHDECRGVAVSWPRVEIVLH